MRDSKKLHKCYENTKNRPHTYTRTQTQTDARARGGQERQSIRVCTQIATVIMIIITIEMNPRNYLNARMTQKNNKTTTTKFLKTTNSVEYLYLYITI